MFICLHVRLLRSRFRCCYFCYKHEMPPAFFGCIYSMKRTILRINKRCLISMSWRIFGSRRDQMFVEKIDEDVHDSGGVECSYAYTLDSSGVFPPLLFYLQT